MKRLTFFLFFSLIFISKSFAISITSTSDANLLQSAILGETAGINVTSSNLLFQQDGARISSGIYSNASNTYGIGDGIVISSGNVNNYNDGPNLSSSSSFGYGVAATPEQEALLDPLTGGSFNHRDVTQFDLVFDVDALTNKIFFNVVFGSEEFDTFVGSFIDAFGIYLNGSNIAMFNNEPVNIDHPDMNFTSGTELNGILDPTGGTGNPVMLFEGEVTPGSSDNQLSFIIADTLDSSFDSVAFVSGFGSVNPGGSTPGGGLPGSIGGGGNPPPVDPPAQEISLPSSLLLFLLGMGLIMGIMRLPVRQRFSLAVS